MKRLIFATLLLLGLCWQADAANCNVTNGTCFWIGGTGTLDLATDSAHWSNTTGGATCSCEPTTSNPILTFDANSGGGVVTINTNINIAGAAAQIVSGAFTGTLDWSVNNNTLSIPVWNGTGTGTRTIKTGTGAWTIGGSAANSCWANTTTTGLTFTQANTITITCGGSLNFGALSYAGTINIAPRSASTFPNLLGGPTFATMTVAAPATISLGGPLTVTNAMTWTGGATTPIGLSGGQTLTLGAASTCVWCVFQSITVAGAGSMTATNSLSLGGNSNISITPPSGGGGGGFVGLIGGS